MMQSDLIAGIAHADAEDFLGMSSPTELEPAESSALGDTPSDTSIRRADLFTVPENVREIRLQIFEAKEKVRYPRGKFEEYWRFCDNMWTPSGAAYTRKDGCITRHYRCMLHAKQARARESTTGQRNKKSRTPVGCPAAAKKTSLADGSIIWGPAGKSSHNHDVTKIDSTRRSSFLRDMAKQEAMSGEAPAVLLRTMMGDNGRNLAVQMTMESIGGQFLTRQDVINAQMAYRRSHPHVHSMGQEPSSPPDLEYAINASPVDDTSFSRPLQSPWNLEEAAMAAGLIAQRGEQRELFSLIFQGANNNEDLAIARILWHNNAVTMDGIPPYEVHNIFTLATLACRGHLVPGIFRTPQNVYNFLRTSATMQLALGKLDTMVATQRGVMHSQMNQGPM
ncbi:hypothetical protein GGS21DRAFT_128367 [Xylaria nigripes]|nr:hypothetical protein GGS21DRAFT_128367 [Xylaria nigripes]